MTCRWREAGLDRMRTSPKTCSVYAHSSLVGTAAAEVCLLRHLLLAAHADFGIVTGVWRRAVSCLHNLPQVNEAVAMVSMLAP